MSVMPPEPAHARPKPGRAAPGELAAWAVLIFTGATSVTYNVFHAVHGARLEIILALLLGIAPVFAAACLSHVAAVLDAHWVMKSAVALVMVAGMVLSASATASVVQPAEAGWRGWLFGGVLDAAALLALWAILNGRSRKATLAAEAEAGRAQVASAQAEAREAILERSRLEAELEAARAEMATVRAELGAEMEALKSELAAAVQATTSDRKRTRSSGPKRLTSSPPNKAEPSPPNSRVPSDVDTQAEALRILATEPDISGGELGRRLGKSERYGCMLKNRLAPAVPGPDQVGE